MNFLTRPCIRVPESHRSRICSTILRVSDFCRARLTNLLSLLRYRTKSLSGFLCISISNVLCFRSERSVHRKTLFRQNFSRRADDANMACHLSVNFHSFLKVLPRRNCQKMSWRVGPSLSRACSACTGMVKMQRTRDGGLGGVSGMWMAPPLCVAAHRHFHPSW